MKPIENLLWILNSNTYTKSPCRFPRNLAIESETRQKLQQILENMKQQAMNVSFENVLLEIPDHLRPVIDTPGQEHPASSLAREQNRDCLAS
jgi:hypothetical protein